MSLRRRKKPPITPTSSSSSAKPHQRFNTTSTTSSTSLFGLLFLILCAFPLAYLTDEWLPQALPSSLPLSQFSEERAMSHLNTIASFGIRTVGSPANEVFTPNYILKVANGLRENCPDGVDIEAEIQHPSGAFTSWFLGGFTNTYHHVTNVLVRVSFTGGRTRQNALLVSAHFDTALGTIAASDDIANVAAMLEILQNVVHGSALPHSIIFIFNGAEETNWQAAHGFITQHRWAKTVRSVINLEGSGAGGRAMVVQTGPRHAWLVEAFRDVAPRPHASTMAQEIFQTKIIPGWTDFETYVEFSEHEIAGIDMVFIRNGYVYHTDIDDVRHVTQGTLQHLGNNLLPTVRALASSPYLVDAVHYKDKTAIFFDLAGILLVVFPDATVARVWYIILLCAVVLNFFLNEWKNDGSTSMLALVYRWVVLWVQQIFVLLSAICFSLFVGGLFAIFNNSMSWFSSLYTTWCLFVASSVCGLSLGRWLLATRLTSVDAAVTAATTLWWSLLVVAVACNAQSAYVPALPLFFQLFGNVARKRFKFLPKIAIELMIHFVPCIVLAQYYCTVGTFFVPITGRIGDWIPSDLLVAVLLGTVGSLALTIPMASLPIMTVSIPVPVLPTALALTKDEADEADEAEVVKKEEEARDNKTQQKFATSALLSVKHCLYSSFTVTAVLFVHLMRQDPYTSEQPKRLYIQQTTRVVHEKITRPGVQPTVVQKDQGLWVNGFDHRGLSPDISALNIPELTNNRQDVGCQQDKVYCGWPWYFPIQEMLTKQWYIPVDVDTPVPVPVPVLVPIEKEPSTTHTLTLSLTSKLYTANGGMRLEFLAKGPSHMTTIIEGKLSRWSFTKNNIPYENSKSCTDVTKSGRDCRFVFFSSGEQPAQGNIHDSGTIDQGTREWKFWLETPPSKYENAKAEVEKEVGLRIAFYGHYGLDVMTEGNILTTVRRQLPKWVTLVSWISEWHQYEF